MAMFVHSRLPNWLLATAQRAQYKPWPFPGWRKNRAKYQLQYSTAAESTTQNPEDLKSTDEKSESDCEKQAEVKVMTIAEQDEELRLKLEGRSGDGGAAGIELEGGKPVAMKRGVRDNMFRVI